MARFAAVKKSYGLFAIGAMEIGLPFVRMMILSRVLDLRELGFASALASAYSLFDQITDIAIFRFVYSMPREEFEEALAGAHALSVLRGIVVALLAFALSPLIAAAFGLHIEWLSFAALSGVIFLRSFEHLEPKVLERDYEFGPQVKTTLGSNGLCFISLVAGVLMFHDHRALTASLFGLALGFTAVSHLVARTPYRLAFRSPYFRQAFQFGYPLMLNGVGLAISAQGDRFLVGALLGLPALGVYSVVMLAVIVPISMVYRVMGSISSAALYNAAGAETLRQRVKLTARVSPIVGAAYAFGVLFLANIVIPAAFGSQFQISQEGVALLAFGAFLRIARGEPFNSLLLLSQRTKRLALSNISVIGALLGAFVLMYYYRNVESALLGRAFGEFLGLTVTFYLVRNMMHGAAKDYSISLIVGAFAVGLASLATFMFPVGKLLQPSLVALVVGFLALLGWVGLAVLPLLSRAQPRVDPLNA